MVIASHILILSNPSTLIPSFVATILHPVFFTCGATRSIQIVDGGPDGYPEIIRAKTIEKYLDVPPYYGVALYGQPAQQVRKPRQLGSHSMNI